MHIEAEPRIYSFRIHDERDKVESGCQVFKYGDRGFMYSISGREFYAAAGEILDRAASLGLDTLEGYVLPSHVKLLTRVLGRRVSVAHDGMMAGRKMQWVVVRVVSDEILPGVAS